MDIRTLKAEAAELASVAKNGDATAEQLERMNEITDALENHKVQAEAAARAISFADAEAVETTQTEAPASTLGASFVRSVPADARTRSPKVEGDFEARAITTSTIVTNPTLVPVPEPAPRAPLAGLVNIERVNTSSVDYVVETVTEGTDVVLEGNLKPETTIAFTPNSAVLDTIAHYVDVTRQALEDESRLQGIIDNALRNGLVRKAENLIATEITTNLSISEQPGNTLLDAIRFGMAQVENNDFTPNTVVVNPFDLASLDVEAAGSFREITRNGTFWGMNVVTSSEIPAGEAYVGDVASAVTWFDRGTAAVYTTDADADKFRRNIVTVLAETRAKAAVVRPAAIVKCILAAVN
jgi:hypothetical protein